MHPPTQKLELVDASTTLIFESVDSSTDRKNGLIMRPLTVNVYTFPDAKLFMLTLFSDSIAPPYGNIHFTPYCIHKPEQICVLQATTLADLRPASLKSQSTALQ